jgi:hypothetical protein
MKKSILLLPLLLFGCIGEDVIMDEVDPILQITNPIISLEVNTFYQFEYMFLNNVGVPVEPSNITWVSSDESILTVDDTGLVLGVANGTVTVTASAILNDLSASTIITFDVTGMTMMAVTERTGTVQTTSSYDLAGDFVLSIINENDLLLDFASNYVADNGLPGLYVYLSNNPYTTSGAYEIGPVAIFSGAHNYTIPNIGILDYNYVLYYCKPFGVKVGHGTIN